MTEDFIVRDSGEHSHFTSGCRRDSRKGKGRFDLLSVFALERDAHLLEKGATKYDARNWEKGMPFSRCLDSAIRHIVQYIQGDRVEDHLAAARFNLACIMHYEEMILREILPPELSDLPIYRNPPTLDVIIPKVMAAIQRKLDKKEESTDEPPTQKS